VAKSKTFTKYEKDRTISRANTLYLEMRNELQEDIWGAMDPDDIAKRLVTMNCHYHGFNELSLKRMPEVAQHTVTGFRLITDAQPVSVGTQLTRTLRRPIKVPLLLLVVNSKVKSMGRYDDMFGQVTSGKSSNAPLLLPSPAGEMIGPAYQTLIDLQKGLMALSADQTQMGRLLGKILPASKSVRAVCSVFPVIRHFLSTQMAEELEDFDLTKARGDVHAISRTVDMGEMLGLSLKVEAYMRHRVPKD
jgi:hypothetical protein